MRRRSKTQRKVYADYAAERLAFTAQFPTCMFCGRYGVAVHEIFAGSYRLKAYKVRACWLALCWTCNCEEATDHALWPWERQLAVKLACDPEGFNMEEVDAVLAPRRIDWAEVLRWYARHKQTDLDEAA